MKVTQVIFFSHKQVLTLFSLCFVMLFDTYMTGIK